MPSRDSHPADPSPVGQAGVRANWAGRSVAIFAVIGGLLLAGIMVVTVWAALAHPVHPTGAISYGDIVVGAGTLVLAIVTLASVLLGWLTTRQTRLEIELSRVEIEAGRRPILVPVSEPDRTASGPHPASRGFPYVAGESLVVRLRNLGPGVAMNVVARIVGASGLEGWDSPAYMTAVGSSDQRDIVFDAFPLIGIPSFDLEIHYADVSGQWWSTHALYVGDASGAFRRSPFVGLKFDRLALAPDPIGQLLAETEYPLDGEETPD